VAEAATAHVTRLSRAASPSAPWDDEFITETRDLVEHGSAELALAIGLAVAKQLVSWRLPEDTLTLRLQGSATRVAAEARASRTFSSFVHSRLVPAHQRWATSEQQLESSRLRALSPEPDPREGVEAERQIAAVRLRSVSKHY
jgi:hypothetical protein